MQTYVDLGKTSVIVLIVRPKKFQNQNVFERSTNFIVLTTKTYILQFSSKHIEIYKT